MRTSNDLRRRQAISGILAAVILFAMLFTTGTGYFLFISNQNNQYVAALNQFETSYRAKSTESAVVTPASSSGSTVRIIVRNAGASVINITAIVIETAGGSFCWYEAAHPPATSRTTSPYPCGDTVALPSNTTPALPIYVSPGASSPTIDTRFPAQNAVEYTIQVLTSRGNIFTGGYPFPVGQNVLLSQLSQGVGSFVIIAGSLRFYYAQAETQGTGYHVGGFYSNVVPTNSYLDFSVRLQNVDPFGRSITLNAKSLLYAFKGSSSSSTYVWPAAGDLSLVSGPRVQTASFSAVTIPYEGTMQLNFSYSGNTPNNAVPLGTFFLLYGTYSDGSPFAQTIPFAATYTSPAVVTSPGPFSGNSGSQPSTITLSLNYFSSAPQAYWVNSDGTTTVVTSGTPTMWSISFTIPSNASHETYYAVIIDDGTNAANIEVYVN